MYTFYLVLQVTKNVKKISLKARLELHVVLQRGAGFIQQQAQESNQVVIIF